jgi:Tol biopolymer transport system component
MGCFLRLMSCVVLLAGALALPASAGSFESQQSNTTIFDGVKGEPGELSIDANQTMHNWKSREIGQSAGIGFAFRKIYGDFILTVQLKNQKNTDQTFYGLQIDAADSALSFKTKLDQQSNLIIELLQGTKSKYLGRDGQVKNPDVLQVEQVGAELIFSAANYGKPLKVIARYTLPNVLNMNVGVYREFVAGDKRILEMRNLRWVIPAWKGFIPYHHYLGSRLEILDVVSGERKVIYETAAGIEAPNWTSDGDTIIYNCSGRVYKLYLPTKKVSLFNTGFEVKNNNDHIISYKSKLLGITHMEKAIDDNWYVYKLPINGGEPVQLTFKAPSYLHGWSPDGRYILYTSKRNNQFEIYRGNSDGSGEELQLTNNDSMDDGSEYTPDGKYIYFNSSRSGAMRLWRMDADGKNPKQITHDNFNDWFPHISPDGKHILFLSYLPDVESHLHPYYKPVYLRMLPIAGGEPKVVAYLYGGQGTINVPSWSPDGRYVAFVSNSQLGADKH